MPRPSNGALVSSAFWLAGFGPASELTGRPPGPGKLFSHLGEKKKKTARHASSRF
jgi:hypothetical protein